MRADWQRANKPRGATAVHLELLEDRSVPAALILQPTPVATPTMAAHSAWIASLPRAPQRVGLGSAQGDAFAINGGGTRGRGSDVTPPAVAGIDFTSSAWQTSFLDALGKPTGFPAPTGANQLVNLPWINIDTIRVTFTEDVNVAALSLRLDGVNVATREIQQFTYDDQTFTAVWRFTAPLNVADKLVLRLDGTGIAEFGPAPISDKAGNLLQGQWTNGVSEFPSGDGTAGVDFNYRFNVLPGDTDRSGGPVTPEDYERTLIAMFSRPGDVDYSVFKDVDGSGEIRNLDLNGVRNNLNQDLPPGDPAPIQNARPSRPAPASPTMPSPSAAANQITATSTGRRGETEASRPARRSVAIRQIEATDSAGRRLRPARLTMQTDIANALDGYFATN